MWKVRRGLAIAAVVLLLGGVEIIPVQAQAQDANDETLQAVTLLYRHSVISPKHNPPKLKAEWPMGPKQLTAIGMREMYEAGKALRERYVDELGFISGRYKASELYLRASNTDRALQSAQLVMLGLFPLGSGPDPSVYDKSLEAVPSAELAFTPVPIHSAPLEEDSVLRSYSGRANCELYQKYVKALPKTKLYVDQSSKYEDFLVKMASITGVNEGKKPPKILHKVNEIYEPLNAFVQHNIPLPAGIGQSEMLLMKELSDWNYHHQFIGQKVGYLTGGPFVGELISGLTGFIKAKGDAQKLNIYLGHQRTILGVEAALGIETARTDGELYAGRIPPQGAHYAFELHLLDKQDYALRLKFVTKSDEQVVQLPGCDGEMCPVDRFIQLYADLAPQDWRAACNGEPQS